MAAAYFRERTRERFDAVVRAWRALVAVDPRHTSALLAAVREAEHQVDLGRAYVRAVRDTAEIAVVDDETRELLSDLATAFDLVEQTARTIRSRAVRASWSVLSAKDAN